MKPGVIYGVMAGALWGAIFIVPRMLPDFSPLLMSCVRYMIYGAVSAVVAVPIAKKIIKKIDRESVILLIKFALTANLVYFVFMTAAVQLIGVAPVTLIVGLVPVVSTVTGTREKNGVRLWPLVGPLFLVFCGLVFINIDVFTVGGLTASFWGKAAGIAMAFCALFCWSWYAIRNARYLKTSDRFNSNEWSVLLGLFTGVLATLALIVLLLLHVKLFDAGLTPERWRLFFTLSFLLAVGASWMGNSFWNAASKRLPLTLFGQMIIFETLFGLMYGFIYSHRLPRPMEVLAIVTLVVGVTWSVRVHMKR